LFDVRIVVDHCGTKIDRLFIDMNEMRRKAINLLQKAAIQLTNGFKSDRKQKKHS